MPSDVTIDLDEVSEFQLRQLLLKLLELGEAEYELRGPISPNRVEHDFGWISYDPIDADGSLGFTGEGDTDREALVESLRKLLSPKSQSKTQLLTLK